MRVCSNCGNFIEDNVNYCGHCGAITNDMMQQPIQAAKPKDVTGFIVASAICSVLALLFYPVIFGPAAFICSIFVMKEKKSVGIGLLVASILAIIIGIVLGFFAYVMLYV